MKKITVLQIISELSDGGVEAMLMDIYRNIDHSVIRFIFVVQSSKRRYEEEILTFGGNIYQIEPLHSIGVVAYMKKILSICKIEHVDIVHCHNLTQNPILLFCAKIAGVKIRISHSHLTTSFSLKTEIVMPFVRGIINCLATHRLACGIDAGKFLYGKKDFLVIKNAIDINKFLYATPVNLKEEMGISEDVNVLLHVGRLSEQKNHMYLIDIMDKIRKQRQDIILICCGSGPAMEKIRKRLHDSGLEKQMLLLGSRTDIPGLMKSAKLLLLPSLYEGFPVTLVEAQASGLYALASNVIDKDSDLGMNLVKFLPINVNTDEWVYEICKFINNGNIRENINHEEIKNRLENQGYSSENNSKILEEIYMEALK